MFLTSFSNIEEILDTLASKAIGLRLCSERDLGKHKWWNNGDEECGN
jgi:hypothetical protein